MWKPIPSMPGYEASDEGTVRSIDRVVFNPRQDTPRHQPVKGTMLAQSYNDKGQARVSVSIKGRRRTTMVSHMVAEAFLGPRPPGLFVLHWDDNPTNNVPSNLRYGTHPDNMRDSVRNGTHHEARKTECPYGHKLVDPNLYRHRGRRKCLACHRATAYHRYSPVESLDTLRARYYAGIMT